MGIYVYTVRAKTFPLILSGSQIRAHLLSYAYKDCWGTYKDKYNKIKISKAVAVVEKYQPEYVVFGDCCEGSTVYKWNKRTFMTYDPPTNESISVIGFIGKKNENGYEVKEINNG